MEKTRGEGIGNNYLIEHSAGSGKSNTIGWLAHRLASLHDEANERVFDSVIVVTDRVVLDQQLQDTIYQFEHKLGVVQKVDERSRQLAEALENAVPIIITTLQKFPFVSRHLLKMAEEQGAGGTGVLPTRRCAVIVDEAHSSQGGETATDLKEVLGGEDLHEAARKRAEEEGLENEEKLFRSMAKRGRQANLSFFAFTATPKHKTLAVFGRDGEPVHRYTMRQAIEEEFILDVLRHYTTYATYFKLLKACEEDPNVERKKAARALARFLRLHPHNISQKTEVMVEHFQAFTRHKIGGRAKAMVVTGSRLEAVRYKQSFDRYIQEKGYDIKTPGRLLGNGSGRQASGCRVHREEDERRNPAEGTAGTVRVTVQSRGGAGLEKAGATLLRGNDGGDRRQQRGRRLPAHGGVAGALEIGEDIAMLLAQGIAHREQALDEAAAVGAVGAEAGVPPQHAVAKGSLGLVVGRFHPLLGGERPQGRFQVEEVGAGGRGLGVGPSLSTLQEKANVRPQRLDPGLEVVPGQGAGADPVPLGEHRVAGGRQLLADPGGLAAPGLEVLEGAPQMRPADLPAFQGQMAVGRIAIGADDGLAVRAEQRLDPVPSPARRMANTVTPAVARSTTKPCRGAPASRSRPR